MKLNYFKIALVFGLIFLCGYFIYMKEGFIDIVNSGASPETKGLSYLMLGGIGLGVLLVGGAIMYFMTGRKSGQNVGMYPAMNPTAFTALSGEARARAAATAAEASAASKVANNAAKVANNAAKALEVARARAKANNNARARAEKTVRNRALGKF